MKNQHGFPCSVARVIPRGLSLRNFSRWGMPMLVNVGFWHAGASAPKPRGTQEPGSNWTTSLVMRQSILRASPGVVPPNLENCRNYEAKRAAMAELSWAVFRGLCPGPATAKRIGGNRGIVPARQTARSSSTGRSNMNRALTSGADVMPSGKRRPCAVVWPGLNHSAALICALTEMKVETRVHSLKK